MKSKKYSLNAIDLDKILWSIIYSGASAMVSTLIVYVGEMDLGAYMFLVPMINAALYGLKRFFEGSK